LEYFRLGQPGNAPAQSGGSSVSWKTKLAKNVLSRLPDAALHSLGEVLYKHMG
jgi:hypothetical protein